MFDSNKSHPTPTCSGAPGAAAPPSSRSLAPCPSRFALWILSLTLLASAPRFGLGQEQQQQPQVDESLLTLDRIFQGNELSGQPPESFNWHQRRGGYLRMEAVKEIPGGRSLVWHDTATDRNEVLVPAYHFIPPREEAALNVERYTFSDDESKLLLYTNSKRVWRTRSRGDYWVLDIASGELKKIGGPAAPSSLMFAKFSPDGGRVAYVREQDIYVQDLRTMAITRLTDKGESRVINGTFDWVYEEELGLQDGFRWSPDGQAIAYWQIDVDGVRDYLLISNVSGLYNETMAVPYPKVGETNPSARIGVVPAGGGETNWLPIPGDPREHYLAQMDWAGDSRHLVIQQFNRLQNTNRLFLADLQQGDLRTLQTETDPAWVDNHNARLIWTDHHTRVVWLSERGGWQHAYLIDRNDGQTRPITSGKFDVMQIERADDTSDRDGWLYYAASPDNPTQRYLYRVRYDGTRQERLTPMDQPGTHNYSISPDGKWAVHTYSTFTRPPTSELISLPDHKTVRVLTDNKSLQEKLAKLKMPVREMFRIDIGNNLQLDAWCLLPPDFDPARKYPVLFHVYGEPAGQTVLDRWGSRHHLWHMFLAQQGYAVFSVDNRGTPAPRGSEWRKCIYRQVGILASADQAAAVKAILQARPYLDPQRVGVWGWSGGGSMTLNAMFRYPELYHTGISVAPVPNQRHYDTIYQERYMGLPGDNADGYMRGSPIHFAGQLQGNLLLVHGTGDDNCHYQGAESLINELVARNKQFSMFAYPDRSHSINERTNTTRHLFGLMTQFLREKLPPGPK
jgi:dipeptidyl-peptidase-4